MNKMSYWIQYNPDSNKLTHITKQDESNQNNWYLVAVEASHQNYFENNFKNIKYNPISKALIYPSEFNAEQQLVNNNNEAFNALKGMYQQLLLAVQNGMQALTNKISSLNINQQNINNQLNDLKGIASVEHGKNYLTSNQQDYIYNYILANTPLMYPTIFNGLPTLNIPITLSITIDSPNWQYIKPQLNAKQDVTINDNQIIFKGKDVNQLKQILNVEFAKNSSSVWAILHYGDKISIKNISLYY